MTRSVPSVSLDEIVEDPGGGNLLVAPSGGVDECRRSLILYCRAS